MSVKETFYGALAEFLRARDYDAVEVIDFREEDRSTGYCDTCYDEWTEVWVTYRDSNGKQETYEYYGNMAGLIRELTD